MSDEKTEDPTQKRLKKAQGDGQTLSVPTGGKMISFLFAIFALLAVARQIVAYITASFDAIGEQPDTSPNAIHARLLEFMVLNVTIMATLFILILFSSFSFSLLLKKGINFTLVPIAPKIERINPAANIMSMYSMRELKNALSDLIKLIIWIGVAGFIFLRYLPNALLLFRVTPDEALGLAASMIFLFLGVCILLSVVFIVLDYYIEQKNFNQTMKMSKSDVKRERKDQQGDPQVKKWRNEESQALLRDTPVGAQYATVLVVGKGVSIAVRFDQQQFDVPFIVGGSSEGSKRKVLERTATKAGAIVIEDPKLARMLQAKGVGGILVEEREYKPIIIAMYG